MYLLVIICNLIYSRRLPRCKQYQLEIHIEATLSNNMIDKLSRQSATEKGRPLSVVASFILAITVTSSTAKTSKPVSMNDISD
jgi:hypothetical protein